MPVTEVTTLLYLVILLWKNASYSKEKRFCMIKLFCERLLNISSFVCKKNYDHSSYTSRAMASFQKFCLKSCKSRAIARDRACWFLMRFLLKWISIFQFRKLKLKTKKSLVRSLNHIILSFQKKFWAQNIIIGAYKIQNVFEQIKRDRARSRFNCAKMFRCYSLE